MKDIDGNNLYAGDRVATNEARYAYSLKVGTIEKFTAKKVVIRPIGLPDERWLRFPVQVALLPEKEAPRC